MADAVQTQVVRILRSTMRDLEDDAAIEQSGSSSGGARKKLWDNREFSWFPLEAPMKAFLGSL